MAPTAAACADDAIPRFALAATPCAIVAYLRNQKAMQKGQAGRGKDRPVRAQ